MPSSFFSFPVAVQWLVSQRVLLTIVAALVWMAIWTKNVSLPWSWPSAVTLALVAGVASVMARWEEDTPVSRQSPFEPVDLILALLAVGYLTLAKLPSGLAVMGLPLGALAVAQGLLSVGVDRPWAPRLAFLLSLVLAVLVATNSFLKAILGWMPTLLLIIIFFSTKGLWQVSHQFHFPAPLRVILRGLIFAGGVILPTAWVETTRLRELFYMKESGLTLLAGVLGTWAIFHLRRESRVSEKMRRWPLVMACGMLAALSAMALPLPKDAALPLIPQATGLWALGLWLGLYLPWSTRGSLLPVWCAVATVAALLFRST